MTVYDLAYFGLYGNTAICPTCKTDLVERDTCTMVRTLAGMTAHCVPCGEMFDRMEREMDE